MNRYGESRRYGISAALWDHNKEERTPSMLMNEMLGMELLLMGKDKESPRIQRMGMMTSGMNGT